MHRCSKLFLLSVLAVSVLAFAVVFSDYACATEGGGGHYPNGAEDFMTGVLPGPGAYYLNYLNYYTASRFNDRNGNSALSNFSVDVIAEVPRFVYVTNYKILGADWGFQAILPMMDEKVRVPAFAGSNDSRVGLGDIEVDPLVLGWHWQNLHVVAGPEVFLPTGNYDKGEAANPGRNYWTVEPILAVTFLSDNGFEISSKFMYDFNTENEATHYTSGQEFHFDYTLGYHFKQWIFGLGGYYYQQMTDDEKEGYRVNDVGQKCLPGSGIYCDGNRGEVFAFGPQVNYEYKGMNFTLKWQPESYAENRPEGNNLWFKFICAF